MYLNRRDFIKMAGAGLGSFLIPTPKEALYTSTTAAENSQAMLYDATICIGCRACQTACKDRAKLAPKPGPEGIYEMPSDLNSENWTLIELYKGQDEFSFVKKQCMHCVDPACVSVCPVGALQKTPEGPVTYDPKKCIGCRYCMTACPFDVPKYQWEELNPLIQKCDFCADLQAQGLEPACGAACPTDALITGKRGNLLEIAHERIDENPGRYVNHVYGESEVGGTSMLYLSKVSFDKLNYPDLDDKPIPKITWPYMQAVPAVFFGMAGLMTGIYYFTHRKEKETEEEE